MEDLIILLFFSSIGAMVYYFLKKKNQINEKKEKILVASLKDLSKRIDGSDVFLKTTSQLGKKIETKEILNRILKENNDSKIIIIIL